MDRHSAAEPWLRIASDDETGTMLPRHRCDVLSHWPACRAEHGLHRTSETNAPMNPNTPKTSGRVFATTSRTSLISPCSAQGPMHHEVEEDDGARIHPADRCTDGCQERCRHDRLHKAPDRHAARCSVLAHEALRIISRCPCRLIDGAIQSSAWRRTVDALVSFCGHNRSTNSSRSASRLR